MSIAAPFIHRPVATILVTIGLALAGIMAYRQLPVSPLPQVDFPTISVSARLSGASAETMATSVAAPLERYLGQIADVSEMTSSCSTGSCRISLQFGLSRNADGAARDVQAAISAARAVLPAGMNNPTYRKMNPAAAPIMIVAMTSSVLTSAQIYDAASTIVSQKLSQISGVGQVHIGGGSLPAVRVEINPHALFKYGIGLEDVRAALAAANANSPKGVVEEGERQYLVYVNDQIKAAVDYRSLIIAYRDGREVRLSDVAEVLDSEQDVRNQGLYNGDPCITVMVFREPGANIIDVVDQVKAQLPVLQAAIPPSIKLTIAMDRTTTIRASLFDVQEALCISILLVVLVVFFFLHDARSVMIASVAVPLSLCGTFIVMSMLNYSLNNLSLMALIVSTGFVVDDAIIVLENVTRHMEMGKARFKAALDGSREVAFTVLSMSLSLVAVFIPILLMGGIVGRLFREFAVTLTTAVLVSLVVSLTTTPMLCAYVLSREKTSNKLTRLLTRVQEKVLAAYCVTLDRALHHPRLVLLALFLTIGGNFYLFMHLPKGFFPKQDAGQMMGGVQADQGISFQLMKDKMKRFVTLIKEDPAVDSVTAYTGGGQANSGFVFVALKPVEERKIGVTEVIARLREKLSAVPGASAFLQPVQDIFMGGRRGNAMYQYTLRGDDLEELRDWTPKLAKALKDVKAIDDVNSDQQEGGLEVVLDIDRDAVTRHGLTVSQIDNTLYDAFGQRQVSTIYDDMNQYSVIMEFSPFFWQTPESLKNVFVAASGGDISGTQASAATMGTALKNYKSNQIASTGSRKSSTGSAISTSASAMVPLPVLSSIKMDTAALSVNRQGHFAATTLSFNLSLGYALSDAVAAINKKMIEIGVPSSIHGGFEGSAKMFQDSLNNQPLLILAALVAVYIVLGILYESYVHPWTILSTLPSAGVGAMLALYVTGTEFTIIALIGIILLIGIVKKNAIIMIDFALDAERTRGLETRDAIEEACRLRFRPIMMTTMAALFGALPLALGHGEGAEMRQPLGFSIIGGLIFSQILTLYTTPVVYLYMDHLRTWRARRLQRRLV